MKMRKLLIPAALLSLTAFSVATPADAQYRNPGYGEFHGGGIQRELGEIRQQIRLGFDRHMLSRGEADRLTRDADRIQERLQRRAWDGLSLREREDLQRRIQQLRERLRFERFDDRRDRH
jgi:Spy/CpxP family protein refolding chaperone